jgi:hypothetical protein
VENFKTWCCCYIHNYNRNYIMSYVHLAVCCTSSSCSVCYISYDMLCEFWCWFFNKTYEISSWIAIVPWQKTKTDQTIWSRVLICLRCGVTFILEFDFTWRCDLQVVKSETFKSGVHTFASDLICRTR